MQITNYTQAQTNEFRLARHPAYASAAVSDLTVRAIVAEGSVQLIYRLKADFAQLTVPPPRFNARVDNLWKHGCFEVFIRGVSAPRYLEFNFSPSGEWAAYQFSDYRLDSVPVVTNSPPEIRVSQAPGELVLEATISVNDMRQLQGRLQLGLCAVVEAADGSLSYWALSHPSEKPDFHHPDSFTLSLPMDGRP